MAKIEDPEVAAAFDAHPPKLRKKLLALRKLVLDTAKRSEEVAVLEETLKWGQPAYLPKPRTGTTVRLDAHGPDQIALYVHCQTDLIRTFRKWYPGEFEFEGNRALLLPADAPLPKEALADCINHALTYRRRNKRTR